MDWNDWYFFTMSSSEYGAEEFGPYATEGDAKEGVNNVQEAIKALNDGITRWFTPAYKGPSWAVESEEGEGEDEDNGG